MLKRVVRQSSDGRPAFLFTGFLRGEYADRTLEAFQGVGDVFVVTNDDGSLMYDEVRRRFENVFAVEDSEDWSETQKSFFDMEYGRGLLQWQKFEIGLHQIRNAEERSGEEYSTVYKLRTDVNFIPNVYIADTYHAQNPHCLFMDSDKYFGGHRDTVMALDGFVDHALSNYCGRNDVYWPMDLRLLLSSDFTAAKFHWLKFPRTLGFLQNEHPAPLELRQHLLANADYLDLSSQYHGELVSLRADTPDTIWFPSEACFAHYVLHRGFSARGFCADIVQPGEVPLRRDRFDHDLKAAESQGSKLFGQAMKHKGFRRAYERKRRWW